MNLSNQFYTEKRGFIRMKMDTQAKLKDLADNEGNHSQASMAVKCINLSSTGVLIESTQPMVEGSSLEITIPSEREDFPDFIAEGTVIRVTQKPANELYEVALRIEKII
ncbi:PilZ domain-containing protein [Zooshikella harenae]|uniref:PilZ domain-containing protein n=1 Tax=Zooshikella harenae TaxID=2827238 RepID=A0ABS5ZEP6_9GAMM|nr:PilZ domain-containing protein [Zooshikella harenae]MBU2712460.1 PilZ domain-containing protein [Zooshikella harenae]